MLSKDPRSSANPKYVDPYLETPESNYSKTKRKSEHNEINNNLSGTGEQQNY